ncbi:protein NRT1/ PTR FAMILY 7.1-like [Tripterygium wilfordii]|uniref:protein NRT1/ PTR FAMILY 7.1-like n=1 Tax=Tripterygium wilfordii TaxID=458696 RepID=UPI0018F85E79|nr:protein NRT1/ PTR FAMILY 7.1-like [Tripterygium wilfordii]
MANESKGTYVAMWVVSGAKEPVLLEEASFRRFSSSPASPVISRPDFNLVIDTSSSPSPESVTIPEDVTLSVTKFRKSFLIKLFVFSPEIRRFEILMFVALFSATAFPIRLWLHLIFMACPGVRYAYMPKSSDQSLLIFMDIPIIKHPSRTAMDSLNFTNETALKVQDENSSFNEAINSNKSINKDEQKLAIQKRTGGWKYASILLVNQGLATLAFFGVGVNLVLFLTRVLEQDNASAANNVSKWTGTVYMCSLIGAFLSDAYWGRYLTCTIFQLIFVLGLTLLSISSGLFLVKPTGCGDGKLACMPTSSIGTAIFYLAIYLIAFGYGGHQPTIVTFGSDQFDDANPTEKSSKAAFFGFFYFSLNAGSLFSNTILVYYEDSGRWTLGFLVSLGSAVLALALFLSGTRRYRYVKAYGNPLPRIAQVFVATAMKWDVVVPSNSDELYEVEGPESAIKGSRKIIHCNEFAFLDKAATIIENDLAGPANPWRLCTVTQVEEAKCILKMIPIWLCTIIYSVIFTQMASLFVEQGDVMNSNIGNFHLPAASMSAFDICSVLICTGIYSQILVPLTGKLSGNPKGLTELQRMGIGLIIGMLAMVAAGTTEIERLRHVIPGEKISTLSIFWQIPQYVLVGASEVFMYVGQLEFFNDQAPDGIKSFGSSLCMASMSLGNYTSSLLVNMIMTITGKGDKPGWIPEDLNTGHMDRFYFLIAVLTAFDFVFYLFCSKWYKSIVLEDSVKEVQMENKQDVHSMV